MENNKEINRGMHRFIAKKKLGVCPHCNENVYDNQLFVEEQNAVNHYSCYNERKAKEDSGK